VGADQQAHAPLVVDSKEDLLASRAGLLESLTSLAELRATWRGNITSPARLLGTRHRFLTVYQVGKGVPMGRLREGVKKA
jgi:hypothetical protein